MTSVGSQKLPLKGFPTRQMIILALCRICEPISFTSIFPYVYQMIDSFGIAKNANEIGIYAGMVTSAFALAEFSTGMLWGKVSDSVGRKPVLIMGLVGTLISMLMFGFAKSLPLALVARALGGGLNGNIGVIQTTVAELVQEKEHQPRAFAIMPFIWCLGSIIGPSLGGLLAEPTKYYPGIFLPGGLLESFPFLLPNLVASVVLVLGIANGILFLEETHGALKHRRDYGIEAGKRLLEFFSKGESIEYGGPDNLQPLVTTASDHLLPTSNTTDYNSAAAQSPQDPQDEAGSGRSERQKPVTTFTRPVIGMIVSYGILAYHTMGFEQLMPVFLSTPPSEEAPHSLLRFTGGLGMNTQTIGFILSLQGIFSMIMQFFLFPPLARYFGTLSLYRFCMFTYPISYAVVPYLDFLPQNLQLIGVYVVLAIKIIYGVLAYPCNAILLTNFAPSLLVLGAINGVAASCASLARAFSPTITGMVYSGGLDMHVVGLAWWVNGLVCVIGGLQATTVTEQDAEEAGRGLMGEAVGNVTIEAQTEASGAVLIRSADEAVHEYDAVVGSARGNSITP